MSLLRKPHFGTCWSFARAVLRRMGSNLPASASGALADPEGWRLIVGCEFYEEGDLVVFDAPREGKHCGVVLDGSKVAHLGGGRMPRVDPVHVLAELYGHKPTVVRMKE